MSTQLPRVQLRDHYLPEIVKYFDQGGHPFPDKSCSVDCAICREPLAIFHPVDDGHHTWACLPCGHVFGYECLRTWLRMSPMHDCPSCRQSLVHIYCHHAINLKPLQPCEGFNIHSLLPLEGDTPPLCQRCNPNNIQFDNRGARGLSSSDPTGSAAVSPWLAPILGSERQQELRTPVLQQPAQLQQPVPQQSSQLQQPAPLLQSARQQLVHHPYHGFLRPARPSANSGRSGVSPAPSNQETPASTQRAVSPLSIDNRSVTEPPSPASWAEFERASMMVQRQLASFPTFFPSVVHDHRPTFRPPVDGMLAPSLGSYANSGQDSAERGSQGVNREQPVPDSPTEAPNSPKDEETASPDLNTIEGSRQAQRQAQIEEIRRRVGQHADPSQVNNYLLQRALSRARPYAPTQEQMMGLEPADQGTPGLSSQAAPIGARINSRLW